MAAVDKAIRTAQFFLNSCIRLWMDTRGIGKNDLPKYCAVLAGDFPFGGELPELWNVLKGDMSFVSPRPLLVEYLERYSPQQVRRHEVKPGITGWAQINGRNALSRQEKFNLDVWYFAHGSLWLDFKILFLTPIEVIKHKGISHPNQVTRNEFSGNMKSNE